jgi:aryl-alcohol dehydrogenase-like predicted oxidoreductase
MEYRPLGRTGVQVSALCLGGGNYGDMTSEDTARDIMCTAIEAGINLIDTADSYVGGESERIIGRFLKSTGLRHQVLILSKVFHPTGEGPNDRGLSRYHIVRACEASLRRLETDHIDLYLLHRSAGNAVPIEETLEALNDLVRQGKVGYIGCSTHPAWQVMEALAVSERRGFSRFVAESPPYNLLDRRVENELVPLCQKYGLGIIPWSPLAMGMLAGRYPTDASFPEGSRAAANPEGIYARRVSRRGARVGAQVAELARSRGLTAGQLALLWIKDQPGVACPIVGPRTPAQLAEMLAVADMRADDALRAAFDALVPPGMAVANFHNTSGWMKAGVFDDAPDAVQTPL